MPAARSELVVDMQKRTIVGLDLIRFFAALIVVVYHLFFFRNLLGPDPAESWIFKQLWFGWVGVEIFFVISGCVIAFSADNLTAGIFLKHRIVRLYPTIWICGTIKLLAILLFLRWLEPGVWLRYLQTMLIWPLGLQIDGVYWTLQIEIMFYGLIAVILAFGKYRHLQAIMGVLGVFSTLVWVLVVAGTWAGLPQPVLDALNQFADSKIFSTLLGHHGCFFAIGTFIYILHKRPGDWKLYALLAICCIGGLCEVWHSVEFQNALYREAGHSTASQSGSWLAMTVWGISVALMLLAMRFNHSVIVTIRPALGVVRFLGLMTFPLYLVQTMGEFFSEFIQRLGLRATYAEYIAFGLTLGVAGLITAYFEPPLRKLLRSCLLPAEAAGNKHAGLVQHGSEPKFSMTK